VGPLPSTLSWVSDRADRTDPDGIVEFRPVARGPRLSDQLAEQLLESILVRGLQSGDKLPSERELGEIYGVSRTVVREAVRSLATRGIIDVRSGTGLMVAAVPASAVSDALTLYLRGSGEFDYARVNEVRALLEVHVAGLAAERGSELEVTELRAAHARMSDMLAHGQNHAEADLEFHRCIARMAQNPLYLLLLDSIGDVLLELRRETWQIRDEAERALALHAAILDRVAAHDAEGARAAMRAHLKAAVELWERLGHPVRAAAASSG
jgi:GntR family transcriptional repressor for pyruvate dehydrogenase complex